VRQVVGRSVVVARVVRAGVVVDAIVARGDHKQRVRAGGRGDRVANRGGVPRPAEARVDDVRPMRARVREPRRDILVRPVSVSVQHTYGHQAHLPVHTGDADSVVTAGTDRSGDVRAVAVEVTRLAVVLDEVETGYHVGREVEVVARDSGIDHGDL